MVMNVVFSFPFYEGFHIIHKIVLLSNMRASLGIKPLWLRVEDRWVFDKVTQDTILISSLMVSRPYIQQDFISSGFIQKHSTSPH